MSNLSSSLTKKKAGNNEAVRGKGKRPSHKLVPEAVPAISAYKVFRVHSRYSFAIELPDYFYLIVNNHVMVELDRNLSKAYFENALQAIFKIVPKQMLIEKVRVNYITQLLEVDILIYDTLYEEVHMKRLSSTVYESFRSMRDELVRPRWLEYIESHNIKYRIKRQKI